MGLVRHFRFRSFLGMGNEGAYDSVGLLVRGDDLGLFRNYGICWTISVTWEITEVMFQHILPNFKVPFFVILEFQNKDKDYKYGIT